MGIAIRSWILAAVVASTSIAQAQDAAPSHDSQAQLDRAKTLFRQGVDLFQAGRIDAALELFLQSRDAFPSEKNTVNAAICLERLDRFDEAIEMYEQALRLHGHELAPENREGVTAAIDRLNNKVGTFQVASNVKGSLVVDGRLRGPVPMHGALRLTPGRHVLRVLADGYATFETELDVRAGTSDTIDAKLERLTQSGSLRVEVVGGGTAQVLLDGAVVGNAPWEGTLAPGAHMVQTRADDEGSAPARAMVVEGQTVLLRVKPASLGPRYVIEVTPSTAHLSLNGVQLGKGRWDGFLPAGDHDLLASEEGYFEATQSLHVDPGKFGTKVVTLRLQVDEEHPRWPKPPSSHLWVAALGGWGLGGGLNSGAEQPCPEGCSKDPLAMGFMVGARAGFELPFPLSLELTVGTMSLWRSIHRELDASFEYDGTDYPVSYALEDTIRLKGPFVAGGISYRVPVRDAWSLVGRTTVGAWFAQSTDTVTGTVGGEPLNVAGAGETVTSTIVFVAPELGAQWTRDAWSLSAGLSVLFSAKKGPDFPHGTMGASPDACSLSNPGHPACAPQTSAIANEWAYGPFSMLMPQVSVSRRF